MLLGEGLSNQQIAERLFITRKTVEHHVNRVLTKLGLPGRAAAMAYAARRESSSVVGVFADGSGARQVAHFNEGTTNERRSVEMRRADQHQACGCHSPLYRCALAGWRRRCPLTPSPR